MKKVFLVCFIWLSIQTSGLARDFIVEFVEENYKETQSSFSYSPIIYHSIQVRTQAGPKLLILKGEDYYYRKWFREYIAENKAFIAKIPEYENDLFISSSAFEIDVTALHPFNLSKYRHGEEKSKDSMSQLELELSRSRAAKENELNKKDILSKDKKKSRLATLKQKQDDNRKAAEQEEKIKQDDEKKRREQEKQIKAFEEQKKAEESKLKQELEEQKKVQQELLTALTQQRADEEKRRQDEFEQRWFELKKRLLEDERIRGLEQDERYREIERRWLELKARLLP